MHQNRHAVSKKIPITRKGTKYVVRTNSHLKTSVPVLIALREMLKLAKSSKEVKAMIHHGMLKINNKPVTDHRQAIKIFNLLTADKNYMLTFSPNGKYTLQIHDKQERPCKVINKKLLSKNTIQYNLHDGSNLISKEKISVQDTVYLDKDGKVKSVKPLEKSAKVFIFKGKYSGKSGVIKSIDSRVTTEIDSKAVILEKGCMIAI